MCTVHASHLLYIIILFRSECPEDADVCIGPIIKYAGTVIVYMASLIYIFIGPLIKYAGTVIVNLASLMFVLEP